MNIYNDTTSQAAAKRMQAEADKQMSDLRLDIAKSALIGYVASFGGVRKTQVTYSIAAEECFAFADAMIAERAKEAKK